MAVNFKIMTSHTGDTLHLDLTGDFDGSSAWELLNNISDNVGNEKRILINTNGIKDIHPFGQSIFENGLLSAGKSNGTIILIGRHARRIAPDYLDSSMQFSKINMDSTKSLVGP